MSRFLVIAATGVFFGVSLVFPSAALACGLCDTYDTPVYHAATEAAPAETIPLLSSRPGAAYTVYLNFGGFDYVGAWGDTGKSPDVVPAYAGSAAQIAEAWARTSEKFAAFDVNVTTIDPSGFAPTDYLARQNYYDDAARVIHTVVGGSNAWFRTGIGGVSYVGVADKAFPNTNGLHTNWAFPANLGGTGTNGSKNIAEAAAHEYGHALGLWHQNDHAHNPKNTYSTNNRASGTGSYAPLMGTTYLSQRGTWRVGTIVGGESQNDVAAIGRNDAMGFASSPVGESFDAATPLPLFGTTVDAVRAQGVIRPVSLSNPNAIGIENYTKNYFRFSLAGETFASLTAFDGDDWLTPGVVAPGATLRSRLNLYRAGDRLAPFAVASEASDTMSRTWSGVLGAGEYFAEITSFGGYTSAYDPSSHYFDMGSYLLRGALTPVVVPEAGTMAMVLCAVCWLTVGNAVWRAGRKRREPSFR